MLRLKAILACFPCGNDAQPIAVTYPDEKAALLTNHVRPASEIADDIVHTLLYTSLTGPALRMKLDSLVGTTSWSERIARWVLEKLSAALQASHDKLGPVVRAAYHQAWDVAQSIEGFIIEHPVMCTVIALGVLVIVAPWVLEALGFAELGPVEGTFASWWQSTYSGLVPKRSLFSFFQRLGMVWKRVIIV